MSSSFTGPGPISQDTLEIALPFLQPVLLPREAPYEAQGVSGSPNEGRLVRTERLRLHAQRDCRRSVHVSGMEMACTKSLYTRGWLVSTL